MQTDHYIPIVRSEFERLKKLAEDSIAQIAREAFFAKLGPNDNSIAVIVKHMAGNMKSRWTDFLTTDGEKPDRQRDFEFIIKDSDTRETLLEAWEEGWSVFFATLSSLDASDLGKTVLIRGEGLSVIQAINRQLAHYAYHVGQIILLAKHFANEQWQSLSIPIGQSEEFNKRSEKYSK